MKEAGGGALNSDLIPRTVERKGVARNKPTEDAEKTEMEPS